MGSLLLDDYRDQVATLLRTSALEDALDAIEEGALEACIDEAVSEYSRDRPRHVVDMTLDGDGSASEFRIDDLNVPFEWEFSRFSAVEHPTGEDPRVVLDENEYGVGHDDSGNLVLRFDATPESGTNNIRLDYSARHSLSTTASTIADADHFAICRLAAAIALESLSIAATHGREANVEATEIAVAPKSTAYRVAAEAFRTEYRRRVKPVAGTHTRDWDQTLTWGRPRLNRPARWQ